jgi:hypothetical protein
MSDGPQRFEHVRKPVRWGRILAIVGVEALIVVAAYMLIVDKSLLTSEFGRAVQQNLLAVALIGVGLILAAGLIFIWGLVDIALKIEATTFRTYDALRDIHTVLEEYRPHVRLMADNSQLSDAARAIIHRAKERSALRLAINEEIVRGDWEAAYALVELLESRHGYKYEAARLRAEVDKSREQLLNAEVTEAVARVRADMAAHNWDRARREMDRLVAEQPDSPAVRELPPLFTKLRGEHKRRLLKEWDESVQRNEVDRGIAILRELDQYLTPNEAAALEESARGVFRTKLHNLGVRFSLAVTDHDWRPALETARQIIAEFPNSRMALEVRDRIQFLTARAADAAAQLAGSDKSGDKPASRT